MTEANVRLLAQQDPTANRMRAFGDDLRHAKALVADLTSVLKRLDEESSALTDAGVRIRAVLGPREPTRLGVVRERGAATDGDEGKRDGGKKRLHAVAPLQGLRQS